MFGMKNKTRQEEKRNTIINAAVEAFQQLGYDNASMDYIAELAQASKRTVYNYFPGKELLFQEVLNRLIRDVYRLKEIKYDAGRSLQEQLGDFAEVKIAVTRDPAWLSLMKVAIGVFISHPEIAQETIAKAQKLERNLVGWLEAAAQDGRMNLNDPQLAADIFWSMVSGGVFWPAIFEEPKMEEDIQQLKQEIIDTFLLRYGK